MGTGTFRIDLSRESVVETKNIGLPQNNQPHLEHVLCDARRMYSS